jgi:hypothetical protein
MRRRFGAADLALVACLGAASVAPALRVAPVDLPPRLSDREFWGLVNDDSEPGGYFPSDNFVSNETLFQTVIPALQRRTRPGGVYLGVGPDQNFTYVVALQPKIAFVIDIRRQNLLEHLMYKALLELSADRADFLSRLFSRKRPPGLGPKATALELLEASFNALPDPTLYRANLAAILATLKKHGFTLSPDDESGIVYVYGTFFAAGPAITYSFSQTRVSFGRGFGGRGFGGRGMPNYADLMLANDGDGVRRSYLATEANFTVLKTIERDNLLVPLVGNFAGDKAIRAVGRYLKAHGATVTAFYLSNVEQYLFQDPATWKTFYANVGALPLDGASTFIRSCFQGCGGTQVPFSGRGRAIRGVQLLEPITDLLAALKNGKINSYSDVITRSK